MYLFPLIAFSALGSGLNVPLNSFNLIPKAEASVTECLPIDLERTEQAL